VADEPFRDPDPTAIERRPEDTSAAAWQRLDEVPAMDDAPVHWDPQARRFVEDDNGGGAAARPDPGPAVDPDATSVIGPVAEPPADRTRVQPVALGAEPAAPPRAPRPVVGSAPPAPPAARRRAAPPSAPPPRRSKIRRRWPLALVVVLVVVIAGPLAFGWWQFSRIERVPVADVLSAGGVGTNVLIVGSDSREGIAADDPNAGAFVGVPVDGQRADTIIVLRIASGSSSMLSIPRDLWVTNPVTGEQGRINSTYASGPEALIGAVQSLGIPVQRYVEIDFLSFGGLVDALGGVTVEFAHPARDTRSGLVVPEAGAVVLDGEQALAYVRSRAHEEQVDGRWVTDPTGDLGRVQRQRLFLTTLLDELAGVRNPVAATRGVTALVPGLRIDDAMTFLDALRLGWSARGLSPQSVDLPVAPRTTSGGAAVLELREPEAGQVIAGFSG
jgi:LCP family protein required for cell wall assembly